MWPSLILFSLIAGFFLGHGFELPAELAPLVIAIVVGFLAIKATDSLSEQR